MFPLYDQSEWLSIVATVQAEQGIVSSTKSSYFNRGSSGALTSTSSTNGMHLAYVAYEPSKNKLHILYSGAS